MIRTVFKFVGKPFSGKSFLSGMPFRLVVGDLVDLECIIYDKELNSYMEDEGSIFLVETCFIKSDMNGNLNLEVHLVK